MSRKHKWLLPRLTLVVSLAVSIVLLVATGTAAWLTYERSLQTVTAIEVPTLSLKGSSDDTLPIDIGQIDVSSPGSKATMFRILTTPGTGYLVQLGHTTNIPLTYTIYPVSDTGTNTVTENGITYHYGAALSGSYRNRSGSIANSTLHGATYGSYNNVQKNAEPLYWQSETQASDSGEDFYVLVVSWDSGLENGKETDMIYLTAGIGGADA